MTNEATAVGTLLLRNQSGQTFYGRRKQTRVRRSLLHDFSDRQGFLQFPRPFNATTTFPLLKNERSKDRPPHHCDDRRGRWQIALAGTQPLETQVLINLQISHLYIYL